MNDWQEICESINLPIGENFPKIFYVFIARHQGCDDYVTVVQNLLNKINEESGYREYIKLISVDYANNCALPGKGPIQGHIEADTAIEKCQILIGLFKDRVGIVSKDEVERGRHSFPGPQVFVYKNQYGPRLSSDTETANKQTKSWNELNDFCTPKQDEKGKTIDWCNDIDNKDLNTALNSLREQLDRDLRNHIGNQIKLFSNNNGHSPVITAKLIDQPYPGMRAMETKDKAIFFGREKIKQTLINWVLNGNDKVTGIVGVSGTGKSSLAMAGVLANLGVDEHGKKIPWRIIRPQKDPFHTLAVAINDALPDENKSQDIDTLQLGLSKDYKYLKQQVSTRKQNESNISPLILYIDQLEELIYQTPEKTRKLFLDAIAKLIDDQLIRILVTLRSDPNGTYLTAYFIKINML